MMRRLGFSVVLLIICAGGAQAQIFGLIGGKDVVTIDPLTGAASSPLISFVQPQSMVTFDPIGRRLFFSDGNGLSIYDPGTNQVTFHPLSVALTSVPQEMTFDPGTGMLFVLTNNGGTIDRIDPATGTVQNVLATGVFSILAGGLSIDGQGRRLFFIDSSTTLYTVNLATTTISSVALSSPVSSARYDPATGLLIGLTNQNVLTNHFVTVNTGMVTEIAPITLSQIIGGFVATLVYDPLSRTAVTWGFGSGPSFPVRLVVFDVASLQVRTLPDASNAAPIAVLQPLERVPVFSPLIFAVLAMLLCALGVMRRV